MTRRATDNTKALDAFIAAKTEIDAMLERLAALSADHFETHPDEIHWGHLGTLSHYRVRLNGNQGTSNQKIKREDIRRLIFKI